MTSPSCRNRFQCWPLPAGLPGDILLTGSPAGNGQHWKRFLQDGDVMTGSIAGLGTQVVRCVAGS